MLVIIVIAPTARSPPYLERLDVKLIDKILSVDNITNVDIPSARHGPIIFASSLRLAFLRRRIVLLPVRKCRIHTAPTAWLSTVASAAPLTPILNTNINIGSRTILITAPITVVSMLILANPCVVINMFIAITIRTNTLPRIYILAYDRAYGSVASLAPNHLKSCGADT